MSKTGMSKTGYVAFDLGAESGRTMLAILDADRVEIQEINRFENRPLRLPSGDHWDLFGLWNHLVEGLRLAGQEARRASVELVSLGVDTWGVDFGLLGESGQLLGLPYTYRDSRHQKGMDQALSKLDKKTIYEATGIQIHPFNTLYQLVSLAGTDPHLLRCARQLLNMPDLFHYFFTGNALSESTIVSTTQMCDPHTQDWNTALLTALEIPNHFLCKQVAPGTVIGKIREAVAEKAGVGPIDVTVPGGHDTASAVAAVPVSAVATGAEASESWAYLSSGTWSLLGAEIASPIVTEAARNAGFTNERGVCNTVRFLKNIAGLWLLQQVRADLAARGKSYDYGELMQLAERATPFRTLLDPDHSPFAAPGTMCQKIDAFADTTGQPKPDSVGAYARAVLESLAFAYRQTLKTLEQLLGTPIDTLYLVGGGGKNLLLNQMTADAIGRKVVVGPQEASAIGNALTQAMGQGQIESLTHLRQVVRSSFELSTWHPKHSAAFDREEARYRQVCEAQSS